MVTNLKTLKTYVARFSKVVGATFNIDLDSEYLDRCKAACEFIVKCEQLPTEIHLTNFWAQVNSKFRINAEHLSNLYGKAAKLGVTFNFHRKAIIQDLFDRNELEKLAVTLETFGVSSETVKALMSTASAASSEQSLEILRTEISDPSKLRRDIGSRDIQQEILKGLFASFLWASVSTRDMHRFFDPNFSEENYQESFWEELQQHSSPRLFHRDQAAHILSLSKEFTTQFQSIDDLRVSILSQVKKSYQDLNNYGFLAVLLPPMWMNGRDISWEMASDILLFGEKHLERKIDRGYFRHDLIRETTENYIQELKRKAPDFTLGNEGFSYRDCFAIEQTDGQISQLLILQKNERDETIVPCPACRSHEVSGNSYPSLGVKSWECANPLCPERSKYNRGKRYSFKALAMQQALDDERNEISPSFVKRWRRDVVLNVDFGEILELIVRHYSMHGDRISIIGGPTELPKNYLGRTIDSASLAPPDHGTATWFGTAKFFERYVIDSESSETNIFAPLGDENLKVFNGRSQDVLASFRSESIDAAVTSPPYYNAREYSQWPNIYCYLRDMYLVNKEVFRTLKPGALYYYNIFDYFDNENILALSAMGQKRIILSAYTTDLFRRIGFECVGNIVWDKGEIEGKRGFNAGNYSPFYQAPFNCWEHVLIFRKPGKEQTHVPKSRVLPAKPVIKIVRGENVHGHTAPFPEDIPNLALLTTPKGGVILDPFGGSLTTGRVAAQNGRHGICIEQSAEYCELGLRLYKTQNEPLPSTIPLF